MIQNAWRHILYSIVAINLRFRCLIAIYFNFLEEKDFAKIIFPLSPTVLQLRTIQWHWHGIFGDGDLKVEGLVRTLLTTRFGRGYGLPQDRLGNEW